MSTEHENYENHDNQDNKKVMIIKSLDDLAAFVTSLEDTKNIEEKCTDLFTWDTFSNPEHYIFHYSNCVWTHPLGPFQPDDRVDSITMNLSSGTLHIKPNAIDSVCVLDMHTGNPVENSSPVENSFPVE